MRGADLNVAKLSPGTGEKSLEGEVYIVSALASWKGDARRNPGVNSECLNTSYDVCDLLNPFHRAINIEFAIKVYLRL